MGAQFIFDRYAHRVKAQCRQLVVQQFQSTMQALEALYPKLSVGGYVIVDDYGGIEQCRQAVHDYRKAHGISDAMTKVDWTGVHWKRSS